MESNFENCEGLISPHPESIRLASAEDFTDSIFTNCAIYWKNVLHDKSWIGNIDPNGLTLWTISKVLAISLRTDNVGEVYKRLSKKFDELGLQKSIK